MFFGERFGTCGKDACTQRRQPGDREVRNLDSGLFTNPELTGFRFVLTNLRLEKK